MTWWIGSPKPDMKPAKAHALFAQAEAEKKIPIRSGENVHHVVPQHICPGSFQIADIKLQLRVKQPVEDPVWVEVRKGANLVGQKGGALCPPGRDDHRDAAGKGL